LKQDIWGEINHKLSEHRMRFKETENRMISSQVKSVITSMNAKLTKAITKAEEFSRMRTDPKFSSDFIRIAKKKELISQINNIEKLMDSLKDDLNEPSTVSI